MKNIGKVAVEIYMIFRKFNGSITAISGFLGRDDKSRLSRQINPNDDRRDNFYIELLEAHREMVKFSPEMEEEIWQILERERSTFRQANPTGRLQIAELVKRTHSELGDVNFALCTNAAPEDLEREAFEAMQAATDTYERVRQMREERENFIN